jgi:ABC-type phosphate transport system substrate-binding protein
MPSRARRLTILLMGATLIAWPRMDVARAKGGVEGSAAADAPLTEPLAIVVNRSNPVDDLSSAELRNIFLGNRSHWSNGRRITLVMREPGEPERRTIVRDVCGMNEEQLKNHFVHGLFTGEILVSPKILASATGVRKFVFNVPGGIGYLRPADVDPSVKVLRIDELRPEDKGYKLHVQIEATN